MAESPKDRKNYFPIYCLKRMLAGILYHNIGIVHVYAVVLVTASTRCKYVAYMPSHRSLKSLQFATYIMCHYIVIQPLYPNVEYTCGSPGKKSNIIPSITYFDHTATFLVQYV